MKNVSLIIIINLKGYLIYYFIDVFLEGLFKMRKSDSKSYLLIVIKVILLLFK